MRFSAQGASAKSGAGGTVNGEKLMLSFHRPPAEKDVQCDIYFGEATIGALAALALMQALALTPITRDGRTILVHVGAWFMEGRSRC